MDALKGIHNGNHPLPGTGAHRPEKGDFLVSLKEFTGRVNGDLIEADKKAEAFALGERYDLHEIVLAAEKADISFRLLMQVRNKVLEAYQEIMRMQV